MVADGFRTTLFPCKFPGIHTYVCAPDAVTVVDAPWQMAGGVAVRVTAGNGLTLTVVAAVAVQPAAEVPVTV